MYKQPTIVKNRRYSQGKGLPKYLGYSNEPPEHISGLSSVELETETLANKFYLKYRVRRNINKMRHHMV